MSILFLIGKPLQKIMKWFQNNDHQDRVFEGKVKKRGGTQSHEQPEHEVEHLDLETEAEHLKELRKELQKQKRHWDIDKVTRLLCLTHRVRLQNETSPSSNSRIGDTLKEFPCFTEGVYIIQELFHLCGGKYDDVHEVFSQVMSIRTKWIQSLVH